MTEWNAQQTEAAVRLALQRCDITATERDVTAAAAQLRAVLTRLAPLDAVAVEAEEPLDLDWTALR